jgi:hypothetical protein
MQPDPIGPNEKRPLIRIFPTARSLVVATAIAVVPMVGLAAPARADAICSDCVNSQVTQTPAGVVTVSVTPDAIVTVHVDPISPNTFVFGLAFQYPPGPTVLTAYQRTSVTIQSVGTVNIDTIVYPPGPPVRPTFPNIVIISIHPPSPCRVQTVGSTVTFTPINAQA